MNSFDNTRFALVEETRNLDSILDQHRDSDWFLAEGIFQRIVFKNKQHLYIHCWCNGCDPGHLGEETIYSSHCLKCTCIDCVCSLRVKKGMYTNEIKPFGYCNYTCNYCQRFLDYLECDSDCSFDWQAK